MTHKAKVHALLQTTTASSILGAASLHSIEPAAAAAAEAVAAVFAVYVADLERCLRHFRIREKRRARKAGRKPRNELQLLIAWLDQVPREFKRGPNKACRWPRSGWPRVSP